MTQDKIVEHQGFDLNKTGSAVKPRGFALPMEQSLQARLEAVGVGKGARITKITPPPRPPKKR